MSTRLMQWCDLLRPSGRAGALSRMLSGADSRPDRHDWLAPTMFARQAQGSEALLTVQTLDVIASGFQPYLSCRGVKTVW